MSLKGKNLGVRTLSGAILGMVVVGAVLWGPWPAAVVFTLIAIGSITELLDISSKRLSEAAGNYFLTIGLAGGWVTGVALNPDPMMLLTGLLFVPVIFVAEVFRKSDHTIVSGALSSLSLLYVALPMSLLMLIGGGAEGWEPARVLAIIFIVWVNDIFAYLVGCSIGKHKMCPSISPKKSWEGLFGGLLFAVAFAMAVGYMMEGNIYLWGGLGLTVALAGVVGDLFESKIKRECGVKDSGTLIPGHGGMLDRFDALLLAAPFAYVYMMIFGL